MKLNLHDYNAILAREYGEEEVPTTTDDGGHNVFGLSDLEEFLYYVEIHDVEDKDAVDGNVAITEESSKKSATHHGWQTCNDANKRRGRAWRRRQNYYLADCKLINAVKTFSENRMANHDMHAKCKISDSIVEARKAYLNGAERRERQAMVRNLI